LTEPDRAPRSVPPMGRRGRLPAVFSLAAQAPPAGQPSASASGRRFLGGGKRRTGRLGSSGITCSSACGVTASCPMKGRSNVVTAVLRDFQPDIAKARLNGRCDFQGAWARFVNRVTTCAVGEEQNAPRCSAGRERLVAESRRRGVGARIAGRINESLHERIRRLRICYVARAAFSKLDRNWAAPRQAVAALPILSRGMSIEATTFNRPASV